VFAVCDGGAHLPSAAGLPKPAGLRPDARPARLRRGLAPPAWASRIPAAPTVCGSPLATGAAAAPPV